YYSLVFIDYLLFIVYVMIIMIIIIEQILLPIMTPNAVQPKQHGMNFKQARVYILEKVIEHLNKLSSEESSYLYGNVIKEYHDKLAFLKTVENEDANNKKLERLQKIAFDVETNTLNSL